MVDTLNSIVDRSISEFEDDKIKRVGKNAFRGCGELSSVTLPNVRAIGDKAFKDCTSLEDITVGMNYDGVVSVNDDAFDGCNPVNVIVPKDKVDLYKNSDSWSGFVKKGLTINWGKCGGTEDVVVTYKEGDPLWVPRAFLLNGEDSITSHLEEPTEYPEVGYCTWFGSNDYGSRTERATDSVSWYNIYKLPDELGKYLYDHAETWMTGELVYGSSAYPVSYPLYKGIALYPDNPSDWTDGTGTREWGVGIRKKSDLMKRTSLGDGTANEIASGKDYSCCYNYPNYTKLEDGYYMVCQQGGSSPKAINKIANDDGNDHLWLRTWKDVNTDPGQSNKGSKYTASSELLVPVEGKSGPQGSIYGMKDSITVNWGKCGGNDDVIVTYGVDEPLYIPKDFLWRAPIVDKGEIGLVDISYNGNNKSKLGIYRLPQGLGWWLYENSESVTKEIPYCYNQSNWDGWKLWKAIATYPDFAESGMSRVDWMGNGYSNSWGVGIRTGADLKDPNGSRLKDYQGNLVTSAKDILPDSVKALLNNEDYYLVLESVLSASGEWDTNTSMGRMLNRATGPIYLRRWNTLTSVPNGTTVMGEKYTLDNSMFKQVTLPLTVNWGKCGGEEDVIVNYDKEEGLWIPKEFLTQGYTVNNGYIPNEDRLFLSDGVTKDTSIGYKTYFTNEDCNDATERASSYTMYICVYKLPQSLGKWLYDNAENNLGKHRDYSTGTSENPLSYNYKGIAMYPDEASNSDTWSKSEEYGVGIRTKSDLNIVGHLDGEKSSLAINSDGTRRDYSCLKNFSQCQALEDDAYYLVMQGGKSLTSAYRYPRYFETLHQDGETLYLKHYNTMTSAPTADNQGKKYDVPLFLPPDNAKPLGGKIFYIDPTDNGATYTFYDSSGNKVKGTTVSELASAVYYVKKGTSTSDKVYVYYPTKFDSLQWWDNQTTTHNTTGTTMGMGRINTATVMARTDIPTDSIWSKLSEIRTSSGIDDWFIPSEDEIDKFREADLEAWHRESSGSYLWSSTEFSTQRAWTWNYNTHWYYNTKLNYASVFFARAF